MPEISEKSFFEFAKNLPTNATMAQNKNSCKERREQKAKEKYEKHYKKLFETTIDRTRAEV